MVAAGFPDELFTIKGDPETLATLATTFNNTKTALSGAQSSLHAVDVSGWTGSEAEAARGWIRAFQPPLESSSSSYGSAGTALDTFASALRTAKQKVAAERPLAEAAWDAKVQAEDSYNALNHLPEKNDPDPAVRMSWQEARHEASTAMQQANDAWQGHVTTANGIRATLTLAATTASNHIRAIAPPPAVPNFAAGLMGVPFAGGVPACIPTLPIDWAKIQKYVDPIADPVADFGASLPYGTVSETVGIVGTVDMFLMRAMQNAGLAGDGFRQISAGVPYTAAYLKKFGPPDLLAKPYQFGRTEQLMKATDLASKGFSAFGFVMGLAQTYEGFKHHDGYAVSDGVVTSALSAGCLIPGVDVVAAPLAVGWGALQLGVSTLWPGHTATEAIVKGAGWVKDKVSDGVKSAWHWLTH